MVIAHRGGTADFPENTVLAISNAVAEGVDGLWLSVQVSSDGIPVLYRPIDLATLTDGAGPVNTKTAQQLQQLNAGWNFNPPNAEGRPYRQNPTPIPTLEQAIRVTPADMPLFLDLKQLPAEAIARAVADALRRAGATARAVIYSTDATITEVARREGLTVAESRDTTRQRLLDMALDQRCDPPTDSDPWAGFEMHRDLTITEEFTLGVGTSSLNAQLWDTASVECFKSQPGMKTLGFQINSSDDYRLAQQIGLDAVLVDSPIAAAEWRAD